MTDEERQKFVAELSHAATRVDKHGYYGPLCGKAADEIERLAKRLEELEQRDRDIANDIRALARWI